jgi:uncharacterized integral membrane protein
MLSKTHSSSVRSPARGVIPDTSTSPVANGSRVATEPDIAPERQSAGTATGGETRGEHFRRKAHRGRLHVYAIVTVALAVFLIALAASNTAHVKVNWVFGSSRVSLVWLVLFAAILGWLLGLLASARFSWRTRAPRRQSGARS